MLNKVAVAATLLAASSFSGAQAITASQDDLNTLNYALVLEHIEATFYTQYQSQFTANDFTAAGLTSTDYSYLNTIRDQEQQHVALLTQTISALGGSPLAACPSYPFGVTSVQSYIATAQQLETVGVTAYNGAVNSISSPTYQEVAAEIVTVEARHTSFLSAINAMSPFPAPFDNATSPSAIVATITPFLSNCSASNLPSQLPIIRSQTSDYMTPTTADNNNDVAILQYALTLEHLEATFYAKYQAQFTAQDFQNVFGAGPSYDNLNTIAYDEATHVSALSSALTSLGQTPVPACTYNFGNITDVLTYIKTAAAIEAVGVMAYDGAINGISSTSYQQVAATIATVEGRHVAYERLLLSLLPFPDVLDMGANATTIAGDVSPFIVSCPFNLTAAILAVQTPYPSFGQTSAPSTSAPTTAAATSAPTTSPSTGASVIGGTTGGIVVGTPVSQAPATASYVTNAAAPASGNFTTGNSQIGGLAVCNVIDPTRKEAPWAGSNQAFPQFYDTTKYVCVDQNFLCPSSAPLRCSYGCYTSSQYSCSNGQLIHV